MSIHSLLIRFSLSLLVCAYLSFVSVLQAQIPADTSEADPVEVSSSESASSESASVEDSSMMKAPLLSSMMIDGKECSVSAQVDKVRMYIGDVANLTVEATVPSGWSPDLGKAGPMIDKAGFEIRDFHTPEFDDPAKAARSFAFSTFTTGTYMIPPVPVEVIPTSGKGQTYVLATRPVSIEVVPVPPIPGEPDDIRDIAEPMNFQVSSLLWFAAGILGAGILILVVLKRMVNHGDVTEETVVTPLGAYEMAFARYEKLTSDYDAKEIDVKTFHYGLTEILRLYLEGRYTIEVLSETTGELIEDLKRRSFDSSLLNTIETLLWESDMVKFARYTPSTEETAAHSQSLLGFLQDTKPTEEESSESDLYEEFTLEAAEEVAEENVPDVTEEREAK